MAFNITYDLFDELQRLWVGKRLAAYHPNGTVAQSSRVVKSIEIIDRDKEKQIWNAGYQVRVTFDSGFTYLLHGKIESWDGRILICKTASESRAEGFYEFGERHLTEEDRTDRIKMEDWSQIKSAYLGNNVVVKSSSETWYGKVQEFAINGNYGSEAQAQSLGYLYRIVIEKSNGDPYTFHFKPDVGWNNTTKSLVVYGAIGKLNFTLLSSGLPESKIEPPKRTKGRAPGLELVDLSQRKKGVAPALRK